MVDFAILACLGAAEVFTDLKNGAVAVAKATGNETSQTVGHKYGDQAEKVADDSLSAAGNTAVVVAVSKVDPPSLPPSPSSNYPPSSYC